MIRAGKFIDDFLHQGRRKHLVEVLQKKGITDAAVLNAIGAIPRHFFLDDAFWQHAYEDKAFQIGEGQTISHPYTVAYQTSFIDASANMKVLEIGTGSGYQTAILCHLGLKVFSIERIDVLQEKAKVLLAAMGYKARYRCGDGSIGWSLYAPYDRILVTAGAPAVPPKLLQQLAIGGKLIIPIGNENQQLMHIYTRTAEDGFTVETDKNFAFVPLIGEQAWKR